MISILIVSIDISRLMAKASKRKTITFSFIFLMVFFPFTTSTETVIKRGTQKILIESFGTEIATKLMGFLLRLSRKK